MPVRRAPASARKPAPFDEKDAMADSHEKGSFRADIPLDAVEEALRSVERHADPSDEGETAPAEAPADPSGEDATPGAEGGPEPLEERARRLEAELERAEADRRELAERLREEHDRLLRGAADLENFRKRAAREREEIQKFGIERVLKDLLPVLDDLDRALASAPADDPLAKGVLLVRAGFEQALARHGVKAFSAMGQPFDPARHEALLQVPTAEAAPGTVVLEHARGFTLNDRVIRPAMVGVSTAPPSGDAG
jgi:molecular chaperone GrpE